MLTLAIIGYGKMGRAVEQMATERGHQVTLRIDKDTPQTDWDLLRSRAQVALEFTSPQTAPHNVSRCLELGVPVVCGSTGWAADGLEPLRQRIEAQGGALFYSANFSLGVHLLRRLCAEASAYLARIGGYQPAIQEVHHIHKLDAPSGTAITLAGALAQANPALQGWTLLPDRQKDKVPIEAVRQGEVPGIHTVSFDSAEDTITLTHSAKNRRALALGAVMAAEFLATHPKGLFGMDDLIQP